MSAGMVVALACPACVDALGSGVYEGFLWGMGLMMATPFFLLAVVGGGLVYARRRALRDHVGAFPGEERVGPGPLGGPGNTGETT